MGNVLAGPGPGGSEVAQPLTAGKMLLLGEELMEWGNVSVQQGKELRCAVGTSRRLMFPGQLKSEEGGVLSLGSGWAPRLGRKIQEYALIPALQAWPQGSAGRGDPKVAIVPQILLFSLSKG